MAPELREQLQAHLGSAYTIERELGGGGMSRVFLAQEVRLERTVVVKVLPPQMAAGVSVDRFEREIHLAATLQHPHIVPLFTAGSAGDLLYYIMPHIEGESLRARLAHDHELPVGETVRILRDVAEALAYAHAHGIVHRDIKPDNVLLSGKHALVADFGVAKAVAESTGKTALTSMGVALGTPAYMAPEQAAADPLTDHRADLYAVGALAYEMLTGHPPFTGTSPQAVLAAQVNQLPEPITKQRASVPPALAALVMRCLEKKPADRLQAAEDLLVQLEAMATPSGGMIPTGAAPAISSGTEAAIGRAHPIRVAALFAAASVGVLTVVNWLMRGLGLPDWVFVGAGGLLLVGLPIIVVTGLVERRRALARSTGRVEPPASGGLQRWLTWRKALWGGAAAFAALGLGTAGYMAMRVLGIGPVGTLVASGVLKERQPILLADFVNRTGDSTLGPTLTEAFRVDLAQSPTVKLVDAQSLAGALERMRRPPGIPLTRDLARELALREGIKAVVAGEIAPVDKGYALSASVVSVADGQVLTAARTAAPDGAHLIEALDQLSKRLRERIGESLRTIRAGEPLAQVTTASLEALRKYSQAVRAEEAGDEEGAASLLEQATALDTGFAMAYRKLAFKLNNLDFRDRSVVAATHAFAHRDRLPELERDLTTAQYYTLIDYDPVQQVGAYRAALEQDPNNTIALGNLAGELQRQRQYRVAESLYVRELNLGYNAYGGLVSLQVQEGRYADAHATLERYAQAWPHDPGAFYSRANLSSAQHDYVAAEQAAREVREAFKGSPLHREVTSWWLALLALVRGRLAQAAPRFRDAMAEAEARNPKEYLIAATQLAQVDVDYGAQPARGLREVAAALARHPLASLPVANRPYTWLARFYAHAGRGDEARRLLAEYERVVPAGRRRGDPNRQAAAGEVAAAEGRLADALTSYQAWYDESGCGACSFFERALVYEQSREADSALASYERFVTTPADNRLFPPGDAYQLAHAYKRLGELYEARGDRAKAREYYGRFVDLWKDADPELQPVVRDVRARLARLAGEP